jgi:acyl dehydratase
MPFSPVSLGPLGLVDVQAYAEASGDSSPIHLDKAAAVRAGLGEPIVHGMLIVGHLIRLAEEWFPDAEVSGTKSLFVRPVYINEVLWVEGRAIDSRSTKPSESRMLRAVAKNDRGMITVITDVEFAPPRCEPGE